MNDLYSLLPHTSVPARAALREGDAAPGFPTSSIVAFVRHCGCPFAENEVRQLAMLSNAHKSLRVTIVCMSDETVGKDWFARIGGNDFLDSGRVDLVCDPTRAIYAEWGVGLLPYSGLFSMPMVRSLLDLKSKGVVNTTTGTGSYRWQNSGGFAVAGGKIKFAKVAVHAGDMVEYEEAVKVLGL